MVKVACFGLILAYFTTYFGFVNRVFKIYWYFYQTSRIKLKLRPVLDKY